MIFRVDLKIILCLILFYFTKQLKIYFIIMIFDVIHEFSHILIALIFNFKIKKITIVPLGISAEISIDRYVKNIKKLELKRIFVFLAGPLMNFFIIFFIGLLNIKQELKIIFIYTNLLIAIFNLIPIYPLDGGQILKSIFKIFLNEKVSMEYIDKISKINLFIITYLFSILIYYLKNIGILLILLYVWNIYFSSKKALI